MDSEEKQFNTICRVCLKHEKLNKTVSLLDLSEDNTLNHYGSTLEEVTKIQVNKNQYLPTNLCQKCKESLEALTRFISTCQANDKKLKKLVKFSLKQELEETLVKEVIHQYTLFSQNFPESSSQHPGSEFVFDGFSTKQDARTDDKYPLIKLEIDIQAVDSNQCYEKNIENKNHNEVDDVDIFINSIKKLLSSNVEDIELDNSLKSTKSLESNNGIESKNVESKIEQFICNICNKVSTTKKTLHNHMQRHVLRYVCDQCGKGFPNNTELVQHQIYTHGAGSQYECDICSHRAATKLQLIEHIRLHTGERPFTCEKCGLTFRRKTLYNKHSKLHGEPSVQCDYCPRKFFIRGAMLAHRNSRHNRQYIYTCQVCNATYAMAKTVKKHMQEKHGIPRHLQGKLHKTYKDDLKSNFQKYEDSRLTYS